MVRGALGPEGVGLVARRRRAEALLSRLPQSSSLQLTLIKPLGYAMGWAIGPSCQDSPTTCRYGAPIFNLGLSFCSTMLHGVVDVIDG